MKIPFYAEFLFFYAEYNNMGANSYEKPDFWSKKAFSEGYPARSVYKLKEMNVEHELIDPLAERGKVMQHCFVANERADEISKDAYDRMIKFIKQHTNI